MSGKAVHYVTLTHLVKVATPAGPVSRTFMLTARSTSGTFTPANEETLRQRLLAYANMARPVHPSLLMEEFMTAMSALAAPGLYGVAIDDGQTVYRLDAEE